MRISLKYVSEGNPDRYGKYTEYEVLNILSQNPMPPGCVRVITTSFSDDENGITDEKTIAEVRPVLFHAFFKVVEYSRNRTKDSLDAKLVEVYGELREEDGTIHWVEAEDHEFNMINYQQYVESCNLIGATPKSFLQYWLHIQNSYTTYGFIRVPEIEPEILPDWIKNAGSPVETN